MSNEHDEIDGIFDHLTPEDFMRPTSAADETTGTYIGAESFERFIENQLHAVRVGFNASDGQMNPVGVLASPTVQRVFVPDDDEAIGDYLQRIKREAAALRAHWFFFALETNVGPIQMPVELANIPVDDPSVQALLKAQGGVKAVVWHAESTEVGSEQARGGFVPIEGKRLSETANAPLTGPIGALKEILP